MKKMYLFLSLVFMLGINSMYARTYYVSNELFFYIPRQIGGSFHYSDRSGTSWLNASDDLQDIINRAQAGDVILVDEGVYKPNRRADNLSVVTPNNRYNSFVLKKDVKIYGGYYTRFLWLDGTPIKYADDPSKVSILSGDIGVVGDNNDNAYHVVISVKDMGSACLSNFIIEGANGVRGGSLIYVNNQSIATHDGGGMFLCDASPLLSNIVFRNNTAACGAAIFAARSAALLDKVNFEDNYATTQGGAIYSMNTNITIKESNFLRNRSLREGGAIFIHLNAPVIKNTIFNENSGGIYGGGAIYSLDASPNIEDSEFNENHSYGDGGAIYILRGIANLNRLKFFYNHVGLGGTNNGSGGAIYIENSQSVLNNLNFESNAGHVGGALYLKNANINISNSNFKFNRTTIIYGGSNSLSRGGGVYILESSPIFTNVVFENNDALTRGGAISFGNNCNPSFYNVIFENNIAGGSGGAIYMEGSNCNPRFSYVNFINNITEYRGGAIHIEGSNCNPTFNFVDFINNKAANEGGAIYIAKGNCNPIFNFVDFINNKATNEGGAIYIKDGNFTYTHGTLKNNAADYGSAVYCDSETSVFNYINILCVDNPCGFGAIYVWGASPSIFKNVTFANNFRDVYSNSGIVNISNSIFRSGLYTGYYSANVRYSLVSGINTGVGNLNGNTDPNFVDYANGNYRLASNSPCINKGDNINIIGFIEDLDRNSRIVNQIVDMGAYEYQGMPTKSVIAENNDIELKIYPNFVSPGDNIVVSTKLNTETSSNQFYMDIYDTYGANIYSETFYGEKLDFTMPNVSAGVYHVVVKTIDGKAYTEKIVVQK